jgi:hypothetical protein
MKWVAILVLLGLATAAAGAHVASSSRQASPPGIGQLTQEVHILRGQVKVLNTRVTKLNKQVATINKHLSDTFREAEVNFTSDGCSLAATADLFIATWTSIDAFTQQTTGKTVFGAHALLDDKNACNRLQPSVTRQTSTPPNFSTYDGLIAWLRP